MRRRSESEHGVMTTSVPIVTRIKLIFHSLDTYDCPQAPFVDLCTTRGQEDVPGWVELHNAASYRINAPVRL